MVELWELADQHRYRVPGVLTSAMTPLQLLSSHTGPEEGEISDEIVVALRHHCCVGKKCLLNLSIEPGMVMGVISSAWLIDFFIPVIPWVSGYQ